VSIGQNIYYGPITIQASGKMATGANFRCLPFNVLIGKYSPDILSPIA